MTGLAVRDASNTSRSITSIIVRDGTNTPRTISEIRVRDTNNVSRLVYLAGGVSPMTAEASPANLIGYTVSSTSATTGLVTVTPTGGASPYTYAWSTVSYSAGTAPVINAASSASSTFTQSGLSTGVDEFAQFRCTVTDANGTTATADVSASFIRASNGGILP